MPTHVHDASIITTIIPGAGPSAGVGLAVDPAAVGWRSGWPRPAS